MGTIGRHVQMRNHDGAGGADRSLPGAGERDRSVGPSLSGVGQRGMPQLVELPSTGGLAEQPGGGAEHRPGADQ